MARDHGSRVRPRDQGRQSEKRRFSAESGGVHRGGASGHGRYGQKLPGRGAAVANEPVDGMPIPGLGELALLWNANEPAIYPNAGNNPAAPGIFPPVGGIRFVIGTYLPGDFIAPEPTPEMHLEDG